MNPLNQTDVANLRESIRATVAHLSGKTVPEAETALQRHLEFLLTQERELFTAGVVVQKPDTDTPGAPWYPDTDTSGAPWYPDDSGKWVEVPPGPGWPNGLYPGARVEVLTRLERASKTHRRRAELALNWTHEWWRDGTIVAYKTVD